MLEQHQQEDPRGELQREIDQLRLHNAELETQISNLEQGQDFRSKGGHTGPEHGTI
jgi:cell division protein FtsB